MNGRTKKLHGATEVYAKTSERIAEQRDLERHMVTRCFTFGASHAVVLGLPFPCFVKITAVSSCECRKEMFRRYGNKWAFDYSEAQIADQQKRFPNLKEVPLAETPLKKFIVRYNVEFSREVEAESEQAAIDRVMADEHSEDAEGFWDQKATSQYEAEEVQAGATSAGEETAATIFPTQWKQRQSEAEQMLRNAEIAPKGQEASR